MSKLPLRHTAQSQYRSRQQLLVLHSHRRRHRRQYWQAPQYPYHCSFEHPRHRRQGRPNHQSWCQRHSYWRHHHRRHRNKCSPPKYQTLHRYRHHPQGMSVYPPRSRQRHTIRGYPDHPRHRHHRRQHSPPRQVHWRQETLAQLLRFLTMQQYQIQRHHSRHQRIRPTTYHRHRHRHRQQWIRNLSFRHFRHCHSRYTGRG